MFSVASGHAAEPEPQMSMARAQSACTFTLCLTLILGAGVACMLLISTDGSLTRTPTWRARHSTHTSAPPRAKAKGRSVQQQHAEPATRRPAQARLPRQRVTVLNSMHQSFWIRPGVYSVITNDKHQRAPCWGDDELIAYRDAKSQVRRGEKVVPATAHCKSSNQTLYAAEWQHTLDHRKQHPPPFATVCHPFVFSADERVVRSVNYCGPRARPVLEQAGAALLITSISCSLRTVI